MYNISEANEYLVVTGAGVEGILFHKVLPSKYPLTF
jgi:hypothetical protein